MIDAPLRDRPGRFFEVRFTLGGSRLDRLRAVVFFAELTRAEWRELSDGMLERRTAYAAAGVLPVRFDVSEGCDEVFGFAEALAAHDLPTARAMLDQLAECRHVSVDEAERRKRRLELMRRHVPSRLVVP